MVSAIKYIHFREFYCIDTAYLEMGMLVYFVMRKNKRILEYNLKGSILKKMRTEIKVASKSK